MIPNRIVESGRWLNLILDPKTSDSYLVERSGTMYARYLVDTKRKNDES